MEHAKPRTEIATFAGGCFWCMVQPFDTLPGIESVISGYTGGHTENPTYQEVGTETTGHAEAVQITFQPELFPYERLLDIYWQLIDPTDRGGQFGDRGASYRTAIFVHNQEQRKKAEASKQALQKSKRFKKPIVTEIVPAAKFYPAEDEHQDYYNTHRRSYNMYHDYSGRDEFAERSWNTKKDKDRLRQQLTEPQYSVTQNRETEPAFRNEYWNNERAGLYVDIINGDPLFSSKDKYDAGTGWPTFSKPIEEGWIRKESDLSNGQARTALRGRISKSHLGHLVQDSVKPQYRINSASLRFIPAAELEAEGYGRFKHHFA
ncbi:peptide-methionine (S)-S-oxide reductase MsrA [Paenibacillus sp. BC26]|uniref:peptide-methionine (S)-S-oxide reductase MsrA n=1 Tax=Paenibacillus sp. BC26 TaxID=1881032 RepID=UPI0008F3F96E|nr:peptide-methionine (S)-S-oxide reductase MsrA [Paenibacillus sp. BC26]SFS68300.1 peptide methionine sulfoxide reductase msrA/msrB [Paenibacillus sp. BC26]